MDNSSSKGPAGNKQNTNGKQTEEEVSTRIRNLQEENKLLEERLQLIGILQRMFLIYYKGSK